MTTEFFFFQNFLPKNKTKKEKTDEPSSFVSLRKESGESHLMSDWVFFVIFYLFSFFLLDGKNFVCRVDGAKLDESPKSNERPSPIDEFKSNDVTHARLVPFLI